jgi:hypothetical protein
MSGNAGPVYDSAEEAERELRQTFGGQKQPPQQQKSGAKLRVIRRRPVPTSQEAAMRARDHVPDPARQTHHAPAAAPASAYPPPSQAAFSPSGTPQQSSLAQQQSGLVPHRTASTSNGAPPRMPSFPATLFWADKLPVLGATYLVAEAMVRTMMMESEEFADRVAWVALERLVRDLRPKHSRAAALVEIRRMLGEIRATHAAFHTSIDYTFVHGAILILLRVTQLASLSAEFAAAPYAHTLDRHVQELVFLCDFAGMVLSRISLSDAPHHQSMVEERPGAPALWMPAHYANEALLRAMPILDAPPEPFTTPAVARGASKMLNDHANAVSNPWLARNLLRLAIGFRIVANAWEASPDATAEAAPEATPRHTFAAAKRAAIDEIFKERATAIQSWTQRNGSEIGAVFMDPLYRIEEEVAGRRDPPLA